MQRDVDRHVKVIEVLPHSAARPELAGAGANDLIVHAEFGNAGAFNPLSKEVAHIAAGDLRRQSLKIVDRRVLVSILLEELPQQLTELLLAEGFAQHAKDHGAFVEHNR